MMGSIAYGFIEHDGGVMKKTGGPGHYDWWLYENENPHEYFIYENIEIKE